MRGLTADEVRDMVRVRGLGLRGSISIVGDLRKGVRGRREAQRWRRVVGKRAVRGSHGEFPVESD